MEKGGAQGYRSTRRQRFLAQPQTIAGDTGEDRFTYNWNMKAMEREFSF